MNSIPGNDRTDHLEKLQSNMGMRKLFGKKCEERISSVNENSFYRNLKNETAGYLSEHCVEKRKPPITLLYN
jgi:hypothetical protein